MWFRVYGNRFPPYMRMSPIRAMPSMYSPYAVASSAGSVMRGARGLGLLGRLRGGMGVFRGINWGTLINNASRALGVVNQTIPLVKQAGPLFNNVRSMVRLASIFKEETDNDSQHSDVSSTKAVKTNTRSNISNNLNNNSIEKKETNSFINNSSSSDIEPNNMTYLKEGNPNFFV